MRMLVRLLPVIWLCVLGLSGPGAQGQLLSHDSGRMQELADVGPSGISMRFHASNEANLSAVQFFGSRGEEKGHPADSFTIVVSDGQGTVLREMERPLSNISSGRALWQTVAVSPPVRVSGDFEVRIAPDPDARARLRIGRDAPEPAGHWMVRAQLTDPSRTPPPAAPVVSAPPPARSEVTVVPGEGAPRRPMGHAARSTPGNLAYRDQHRRLSFPRTPPPIPRGCGRVDVSWDRSPVTVQLSYVGKPPRVLEGLDVKRLVVDFPVPKPGLFEVVVTAEGFRPESRRFLVSAGSRDEWRIRFQPAGPGGAGEEVQGETAPAIVIEEVVEP